MKKVIIAGAGSTLSQAMALRPKHGREHPPLDGNFFTKAQHIAKTKRSIRNQVEQLRQTLTASGNFYDPFVTSGLSLEQFFADVYYDVAGGGATRSFRVFTRLLRLYNSVLGETTNWIGLHQRLGPMDRLMRLMANDSNDEVYVVTFNQDLMLENVAERMPRRKSSWCLHSLYGTTELRQITGRADHQFRVHDGTCPDSPPFRLLKLHGSLNWVVRSLKQEPSKTTLFPPSTSKKDIFVYEDRVARDQITLEQETGGRKNWYLWPLVVPPIYEKHRIMGRNIIQDTWSEAHSALADADHILIIGYSLPDADVNAIQMLRRAFSENNKLETIECINPDANVAGKLKERLGCRIIHLYHDVGDYVELHS
jgi:hypothetical protein